MYLPPYTPIIEALFKYYQKQNLRKTLKKYLEINSDYKFIGTSVLVGGRER